MQLVCFKQYRVLDLVQPPSGHVWGGTDIVSKDDVFLWAGDCIVGSLATSVPFNSVLVFRHDGVAAHYVGMFGDLKSASKALVAALEVQP